MNDTEQVQRLTTELHNVAEQLAASTEARMMMVDTIAVLRNENADLRRQVEALQGCRRVLLTLTDRDPWGDGCAYNAGELAVMQLRGAG